MSGKVAFLLIASFLSACNAASVSPGCVCTRNYKPVCGSDGNTYSNECMLNCAREGRQDLQVVRNGQCEAELPTPENCICTFEYNPVCGTDGQTYPNRCSLRCQKSVEVRHAGTCQQKREVQPPCVCTREMKQVCGSDGKTYGNPCMLNCATIENPGLGIERMGPCSEKVNVVEQPEGSVPSCACTRNLRPVCGSDGETYNNECVLRCSGKDVTLEHEGPC